MEEQKSRVIPPDTIISKYFEFEGKIFEKMTLPDGRILVRIVHTWWDDGSIMEFGFQYSDGIARTGLNPLHIVGIYKPTSSDAIQMYDIVKFLNKYGGNDIPQMAGDSH